jgi:hypothetical protein
VIVAAHQPAYLPWLGYLDKMARADLFVVMDDLQYEAQGFQNRNRIKLAGGPAWLTVPLERGARSERIRDKRIALGGSPREDWRRRTWTTIKINYGRAPCFARYADALEELYARPWDRLLDLDLHILELARGWFGITTPIVLASSLGLRGEKTARIADLCRAVGATVYLSGRGGSTAYLDVDALGAAGVGVAWQAFDHPVYPQRYPALGFAPRLAFLDLLLNCGPDSRAVLDGAAADRRAIG